MLRIMFCVRCYVMYAPFCTLLWPSLQLYADVNQRRDFRLCVVTVNGYGEFGMDSYAVTPAWWWHFYFLLYKPAALEGLVLPTTYLGAILLGRHTVLAILTDIHIITSTTVIALGTSPNRLHQLVD
jgi:hypothetical protein